MITFIFDHIFHQQRLIYSKSLDILIKLRFNLKLSAFKIQNTNSIFGIEQFLNVIQKFDCFEKSRFFFHQQELGRQRKARL